MVTRFALKIAYIGKDYQGFQQQPNSIKTIEGTLIDVLEELGYINDAPTARYSAAGRTDKGVNAISQVIAFNSKREELYLEELNNKLPKDIFAWPKTRVETEFNARKDASKRTYRYYQVYGNENIKLMKMGLKKLHGTHDFAKLCKKQDKLPDGSDRSTVLTIDNANVKLLKKQKLLQYEFSSRNFLWKQVRKMVSLIQAVGSNRYPLDFIDEVLTPAIPVSKGGIKPASAEGLVLYDVKYESIKFEKLRKTTIILPLLLEKINSQKSSLAVLELMQKTILD
ncbi:MAG: tRNA pseudouridine(38-40) synthase TruA [Candidatus Heimdallarchaeota archaeon]